MMTLPGSSHRLGCCALAVFALVLLVAADEPLAKQVRQHGWHTDYAAARTAARQSGKPLFIVFRCQP